MLDALQMLLYHIFASSLGMLNCKFEIIAKVQFIFLHIRFGHSLLSFQESKQAGWLQCTKDIEITKRKLKLSQGTHEDSFEKFHGLLTVS